MQNQEVIANFFLVIMPIRKKDTLPELACCMTLWMPLQAVSLLASTTAVALTNRSMDLFQAQVSSNLKCMSSLLWNNHSLGGSYCPHHSMNCAHGEYACTWFPTCKFPRRLEYAVSSSLQVLAVGIRKQTARKEDITELQDCLETCYNCNIPSKQHHSKRWPLT
jgi:hypothetical protein